MFPKDVSFNRQNNQPRVILRFMIRVRLTTPLIHVFHMQHLDESRKN